VGNLARNELYNSKKSLQGPGGRKCFSQRTQGEQKSHGVSAGTCQKPKRAAGAGPVHRLTIQKNRNAQAPPYLKHPPTSKPEEEKGEGRKRPVRGPVTTLVPSPALKRYSLRGNLPHKRSTYCVRHAGLSIKKGDEKRRNFWGFFH